MRPEIIMLFGRILTVLGIIVLTGIVLRLLVAILQPVLPASLMNGLAAGWATLAAIISPAIGPIMRIAILAAICWVIVGRRR